MIETSLTASRPSHSVSPRRSIALNERGDVGGERLDLPPVGELDVP